MKAGHLVPPARITDLASVPSPPLSGSDSRREGDPTAYVATVSELLARSASGPPLGLACQRSTFTLWDPRSGEHRLPLISWQDSRAEPWCTDHATFAPALERISGLRMSPHYAGPKLAFLISQDSSLLRELEAGELLFGTLDSYLIWLASGQHQIDLTMAARTTFFDIRSGVWSPEALARMRIPQRALPTVTPTRREQPIEFFGHALHASLADQAASVLTVLPDLSDHALVSLGTGGFVMRPAPLEQAAPAGFLTAPVLSAQDSPTRQVWEGTINGVGATLDLFPRSPLRLPEQDPTPEAFCIPDSAGLGAPDWLPQLQLTWSVAASELTATEQRRIAVEGLLFRILQILDGLFGDTSPAQIRVSGGPSQDPALRSGLAALFGDRVRSVELTDAGLVGAARLAAGLSPYVDLETNAFQPSAAGSYLRDKYSRWTRWYERVCSAARASHGDG